LLAGLLWAGAAHAQNTAVIFGEVVDVSKGNAPVPDAIVVVESPNLQGEQTSMSDEKGQYRVDQLPPGDYRVKVVAPGFREFNIGDVHVYVGRQIKLPIGMLPEVLTGETIVVNQVTSTIDQSTSGAGLTITKDYLERVTTKRSFQDISEATPGAQTDYYGISFSGSTSPENATLIDGANLSSPGYGVNNLTLPPEFFDQIDVKTGGYMPEYGQATGGFVDSVTKIGGNETHGSVFSYTTPLRLAAVPIGRQGEAINGVQQQVLRQDIGFEVGGAIVKDKLWFHVGLAPRIIHNSFTKNYQSQVDDGSGGALLDTAGVPVTQPIAGTSKRYTQTEQMYQYTAKLTYNISEDHRVSLQSQGNPTLSQGYHPDFSAAGGLNGDPSSFLMDRRSGVYSGLLSYDGKALDRKLLLSARVSYSQNDKLDMPPIGSRATSVVHQTPHNITDFDNDPTVGAACSSPFASGDPRCPVTNYTTGGVGFNEYNRGERWIAKGTAAYLLNLLGTHQLKAGFEFNRTSYYGRAAYTNGVAIYDRDSIYIDARRFGKVVDPNADPASEDPSAIAYQANRTNYTYFNNYTAYLQDSWNIEAINVNINGGARLDFQEIFGKTTDPSGSGYQRFMAVQNWSPRIGINWDFLGNGRAKLFGSYGRFYELIPLSIADRGFPTEQQVQSVREHCTDSQNPQNCTATARFPIGGDPTTVLPGLQGQFVDTYVAGAEWQALTDLLLGINYTHSNYGQVIEDLSNDDGNSYFVGNPGAGAAKTTAAVDRVTGRSKQVPFPTPQRIYDAMNIYVQKSLRNNFLLTASYTLSFLRGHYSGLFRPEDTQLNPNANSDLDLVDLLDNRFGYLPGDRTHQFKFDAAYIAPVTERFYVVPNIVFRVGSGTPYSYTGSHIFYGPEQAFLITRGLAGRTDPLFQVDAGIKAEYAFDKATRLSLGITILNVGSAQLATQMDQRYTRDSESVTPIKGGDKGDLRFVKNNDNQPALLNTNFGNAATRQLPMSLRIDAKLTF